MRGSGRASPVSSVHRRRVTAKRICSPRDGRPGVPCQADAEGLSAACRYGLSNVATEEAIIYKSRGLWKRRPVFIVPQSLLLTVSDELCPV